MNIKQLELLAPAGQMEVLKSVAQAGADAVYLGGKLYNMRALRPHFNFTNQEIEEATRYLHQRGKKIYITVNNLYSSQEIEQMGEYLIFLNDLGVDALIVQDLGIAKLSAELGLKIPLHASVQMGVANLEAARLLSAQGFSRVILSRNLSLPEIKEIHQQSDIGIEYFVHGELCISHTGQCYMSSFVCGESANRGRCRKPCRWHFTLKVEKEREAEGENYFLAHKDLCLYPYLLEMVEAGVTSFKIEGRMRSADFVARLVGVYREALDRLIDNPDVYQVDPTQYQVLQENRVRDFCSGSLWQTSDRNSIGWDGSREPYFPTAPLALSPLGREDYRKKNPLDQALILPELSVKVGNLDSYKRLQHTQVDHFILGTEKIRQSSQNWDFRAIQEALKMARGSGKKLWLETPRVVCQKEIEKLYRLQPLLEPGDLEGIIVNDLGSMNIFADSDLSKWGGWGLNISNDKVAAWWEERGLSRITASLEISLASLRDLLKFGVDIELVVHGPLCGMISDYCIPRAAHNSNRAGCTAFCNSDQYALTDAWGQEYRIRTDSDCRNYLFYPHDLCLFPFLPEIVGLGLKSLRIEGQYYEPEQLEKVVDLYRQALDEIGRGQWDSENRYYQLLELFPGGLSAGPLMTSTF